MRYDSSYVDGPRPVRDFLAGSLGHEVKRLAQSGGSVVLVLPPAMRRALRLVAGDQVALVLTEGGTIEVAPLSASHRLGAPNPEASAKLTAVTRENQRLRRKLRARPVKLWHEAYNAGVMLGLRLASRGLLDEVAPPAPGGNGHEVGART